MAENMRFNVGIKTTADLAGIEQIRKQLNDVRKTASDVKIGLKPGEVSQIVTQANAIETALTSAFDPKLNTVNINKFTQSLKESGTSMGEIANGFAKIGPQGQKAFLTLTNQTLKMGQAVKQTNKSLEKLATTFKNTIKWSISSSIWKNLTTQISGAFSYVKGLNAELNDIRIVTGKSADEMKRFAKEANEAAKTLGDSTSQYVKGALIYAQQGLDDKAIKERTDVTMKMVNVTGDAADEVSSYMTAIWNNFDDGSQSVEHFADVITSLGATTAASTAEIAAGLERFSAIANTVGLSYDYATSALATVVAETRQSADVVGTAFRTLFARIQDLELGKTLDDGTTLGKYSQALEKIGVDIKNANGSMKDMDQILSEMGAKWSTLSADVQIATAQAVSGTRQYAQLIALMDNWGKMQENLATAQSANGTLQKQNLIYLESLNAKTKQLKASGEALKSSLINEDDLIAGADTLTKIVDTLTLMSDALGGLRGLLPLVSGGLLSLFSGLLSEDIVRVKDNLTQFKTETSALTALKDSLVGVNIDPQSEVVINSVKEMIALHDQLNKYKEVISEKDKDTINAIGEQILKTKSLEVEQEALIKNMEQYAQKFGDNNYFFTGMATGDPEAATQIVDTNKFLQLQTDVIAELSGKTEDWKTKLIEVLEEFKYNGFEIDKVKEKVEQSGNNFVKAKGAVTGYIGELSKAVTEAERLRQVRVEIPIEAGRAKNEQETFLNKKELQQEYQTILKMTGAIGQLSFGIQSIQRIGGIIKNKDLSAMEKFIQLTASLSFTIPSLVKGASSLNNGFKLISSKATSAVKAISTTYIEAVARTKALNTTRQQEIIYTEKAKLAAEEKAKADAELAAAEELALKAETKRAKLEETANKRPSNKKERQRRKHAKMALPDATKAAEEAQINRQKADTKVRQANTKVRILQTKASKAKAKADEIENSGVILNSESIKKNTIETLKNVKAKIAEKVAANKGAIAILAAVAIIAIANAAYKKYKQSIVDAADAQQRHSEGLKKDREALQQESEAIDDIVNKYEELKDQYKDTSHGIDIVRAETYKLLLEQGKSKEAVDALTASYDQLDVMMKQLKETNASGIFTAVSDELGATEKAIRAQLFAAVSEDGTRLDNFGKTIDLKGMRWRNDEEKKLAEQLSKYVTFTNKDHIDLESFQNAVLNNREELEKILAGSQTEAGKQLYEYLQKTSELLDSRDEAKRIQKENKTKIEGSKEIGNINSAASYREALDKVVEETKQYYDNNEQLAREAAKVYFLSMSDSIDKIADYAKTDEIVEALAGKGKVADIDYISSLGEIEKNFLLSSMDMIGKDSVESFLDKWDDLIKYLNQKEYGVKVKAVLQGFIDNNGEIDEDALKDLFGNDTEEYYKTLQLYDGAFEAAAVNRLAINAKYLTENRELVSNEISEEIGLWHEANDKLQDMFQKNTSDFENYASDKLLKAKNAAIGFNSSDRYANYMGGQYSSSDEAYRAYSESGGMLDVETFDRYFNAVKDYGIKQLDTLSDLADKGIELTDDRIKTALSNFVNAYDETSGDLAEAKSKLTTEDFSILDAIGADDNSLAQYAKEAIALQSMSKHIELLNEKLKEAQEGGDWDQVIASTEELNTVLNKSLDNLQSAYGTLMDAQDEYNKTRHFSLDTAQALLALEPEYLQALIDEKGQFSVNEDAIKNLTLARIEDQKWKAKERAEAELQKIINADNIKDAIQLLAGNYKLAESYEKLTEVKLENYRVSLSQKGATEEDMKIVDNYLKTVQKEIDIWDNVEAGLKKDFGKGMGTISPKDFIDNEADYYWNQKKAIEATEHALNKLQKAQEHLKGKALLENLKEQNIELNKQKENYEALLNRQRQRQKEMQKDLKSHGVTFNEKGQVSNYDEAFKNATDRYNEAIKAYNKSGNKEAYNAAKKRYDQFKELMSEYTSLVYSEINETEDMIVELRQKAADALFDEMHFEIQAKIDTTQAKRDWNAFLKEFGNMDVSLQYKDLKRMTDYYRQDTKDIRTQTKKKQEEARKIQQEIDKFTTIENYGETDGAMFTSIDDAKEALKSVNNELMDYSLELQDVWEEAWDTYLEGIDQSADKFEEINEEYERLNEQLQYDRQIIELLYGTTASGKELMGEYYKQQEKQSIGQIDSLKQQQDMWKQLYEQADEGSADRAKYYDLFRKAESDLNNAVIEHIQLLKEDYANTINNIMDDLEKTLNNGLTTKQVQEEWEAASWEAEHYLDNVEKIYSIQTLENKINDSIASQKQIKNQQKLQAFYDRELTYLREKEKLTQFDLDAANAHYDIIMKEIALEEAQQSKNSVKLSRGADGNWSYQYVADEDQITSARQDLLDSYNELYQLADSAYQKNLSSLNELNDKYLSSLRELNQQLLNNEITVEEYNERRDKLTERYYEHYNDLAQENSKIQAEAQVATVGLLLEAYNQDTANFDTMTEDQKKIVTSAKEHQINEFLEVQGALGLGYGEIKNNGENTYTDLQDAAKNCFDNTNVFASTTAQAMINTWNNFNDETGKTWITDPNSIQNKIAAAYEDMLNKNIAFSGALTTLEEHSGKVFGEEGIGGDLKNTGDSINDLSEKTLGLVDDFISKLGAYKDAVILITNAYNDQKTAIENAKKELDEYLNKQAKLTTPKVDNNKDTRNGDKGTPQWQQKKDPSAGGNTPDYPISGNPMLYPTQESWSAWGIDGKALGITGHTDSELEDIIKSKYPNSTIVKKDSKAQKVIIDGIFSVVDENGKIIEDGMTYEEAVKFAQIKNYKFKRQHNYKVDRLKQFDTGGYTGDWYGNDGRLALLHQKEMVLNADDTKDILDTVSIVRNLKESIGKEALQQLSGIKSNSSSIVNNSNTTTSNLGDTYYVNAEFPSAENVNEIKEALLSLPLLAQQYKNRK